MPADRTVTYTTPPQAHASPIRIPGTSPGSSLAGTSKMASALSNTTANAAKHARARSASGSSHASSSRIVPPFPTLLATSETVLEQNLYDIMWKTFVAFEQDMRDCSQLAPLLPGIEATVSSAVDPISLAGDCLADCASYIEGEIREAIEETLAAGGTMLSSSPGSSIDGNNSNGAPTKAILACPISYAKQFSLASTRISGSCSTFRATQASLRYYGGARKTAYQLDLFVHKFALPTSTALHKRGQEFSAANKWLKKMLNGTTGAGGENGVGRLLDSLEIAALRRAGNSLRHWAEGLRIHSDILRSAAANVRTLLQERVSLQAYSFPPRPSQLEFYTHPHYQQNQQSHNGESIGMSSLPSANAINSPMSQWTTLNSMLSATTPSSSSCVFSTMPDLIPGSNGSTGSSTTSNSNFSPSTAPSSLLATPENSYAQIMQKGFNIPNTSSNSSTYSPSPMSQHSLPPPVPTSNDIITSPQVQNGLPPLSCQSQQLQQGASTVPTPTCGLAFQTPTFVQDLSIYQSQQPHSQSISSPHAHHHQPQQSQYQQQEHQQQAFPYQQQQQQAFTPGGMVSPHANAPDLSFPTELFFDNLCM